ncbi:hypothetical protein [Alkalihalobacterium bogoriense]|uniref:hypothetical protein n=1 Tax=Alkalihalobacterium bogoriense TaxID=246272 RepID=UPI00047DF93C|nr:hypothetical protein [Alkalihalobacterium bogoriense]
MKNKIVALFVCIFFILLFPSNILANEMNSEQSLIESANSWMEKLGFEVSFSKPYIKEPHHCL